VALGGGATGCLGATIFEVGAALAMLEAVNENRTDCFGWALERAVEDGLVVVARRERECRHHHGNRRALFGSRRNGDKGGARDGTTGGAGGKGEGAVGKEDGVVLAGSRERRRWSWWPSSYELRTHYFRDIGFLACFTQMIAATIFWIAGIVGVPSILGGLSTGAENGVYWVPQVSLVISVVTKLGKRKLTKTTGGRRQRLHPFELAVHARDSGEVVPARSQSSRLAYRLLEPHRRHWFLSLRCSRLWGC
jgi:hypothetical protein